MIDHVGSGHKMCEAIKRHTDHDIEIWTGPYHNRLVHPNQTNIITPRTRTKVQERINKSDIIHLKGDWPAVIYETKSIYADFRLKIRHKPIIHTVSGSLFRRKIHGGFERFPLSDYQCTLRTSFEPDLLYPEWSDLWTPHPIDSDDKLIEWRNSRFPVLMHTPTNRSMKHTRFILNVFDAVRANRKVNIVLLEKLPFSFVLQERKKATIFFDQFKVGFYGNAAIEAMQYGIPTAAFISDMARSQAKGKLNGCPVITTVKSVREWARLIIKILDDDMNKLSLRTKKWCDQVHGYRSIAKQWDEIYKGI